jgi:hypothetical protein
VRDQQVRRVTRAAALVAVALALAAAPAAAEPYLMVRAGAKCSDCHTNLTGGGKRTLFAHIHAHDILHDLDLLPVPPGVKGFNGQVSDYVSIGGDLRVRNTTVFQDNFTRNGNVDQNRAFRRHVASNDLAVNEFLGYAQIDLLPDYVTLYGDWQLNGGVTNREAFGLIKNFLPWDTYVKAGRFFPTFGLRVQDDQAFIRGRTGYTFQNPDEGGEFGFGPGPFFLATSITNGTGGNHHVAVTANGYGVFQDVPVVQTVLAGLSVARQNNKRTVGAVYAGSNIWRLTYLAEFDPIHDRSLATSGKRDQYAAYGELDFLVLDWLNIRGTFDYVHVSHDRDQVRYAIGVEPFVSRYIQPRIQYRINNAPPLPGRNQAELVQNQDELVFELHFFF